MLIISICSLSWAENLSETKQKKCVTVESGDGMVTTGNYNPLLSVLRKLEVGFIKKPLTRA